MEGLKLIPYIALLLLIAGVIIGASVITMSKFGDTMDKCYSDDYFLHDGTVTAASEDNTSVITVNVTWSLSGSYIANSTLIIMNSTHTLEVHTDYEPLTEIDLLAGQVNISNDHVLQGGESDGNATIAFGYSYYTQLSTGSKCTRLSDDPVGQDDLNLSDEYFSLLKGIEGEMTVAEQQPTVAIVAIMVIIISIIAGVFVYMKFYA